MLLRKATFPVQFVFLLTPRRLPCLGMDSDERERVLEKAVC